MNTHSTVASNIQELAAQLGDIPLERVRTTPPPGTATIDDCIAANEAKDNELCELVDGVLVEKAMGYEASVVAGTILSIIRMFVSQQRLGFVSGADGFFRLQSTTRAPDVAFLSLKKLPEGKFPSAAYPQLVPNLVVEVLSPSNTMGEMNRKRLEYFHNGVEVVWVVDCAHRTIAVYTSSSDYKVLGSEDSIDGGTAIPGFKAEVKDFFADLDLAMGMTDA